MLKGKDNLLNKPSPTRNHVGDTNTSDRKKKCQERPQKAKVQKIILQMFKRPKSATNATVKHRSKNLRHGGHSTLKMSMF